MGGVNLKCAGGKGECFFLKGMCTATAVALRVAVGCAMLYVC